MAEETLTGTIARLLPDKGFGFITGADGTEYFFHRSAVQRSQTVSFENLKEQQEVSFVPEQGPKGWRAARVIP